MKEEREKEKRWRKERRKKERMTEVRYRKGETVMPFLMLDFVVETRVSDPVVGQKPGYSGLHTSNKGRFLKILLNAYFGQYIPYNFSFLF